MFTSGEELSVTIPSGKMLLIIKTNDHFLAYANKSSSSITYAVAKSEKYTI